MPNGFPTGSTGVPRMPLMTPAAEVYQATAAVTIPMTPPILTIELWLEKLPMERKISVTSKSQEDAEHGHVHLRAPQQHVGVEDGEGEEDPTRSLSTIAAEVACGATSWK